ncbi:hypothetical protein PIB30_007088 [Stylosanthes scabra]|uniref:Small auxin up regulated protein n=1 Tax=Stylosanthes scabra TaxID=79078 RepID=A0ABU6R461_9FABA|nr:hypothetical protein [Stylosanthes scabra]
MAKLGKLTKIKSAIKRLSRNNSCVSAASCDSSSHHRHGGDASSNEQNVVYVGKSRRRYLVNSEIIDHPVFQELVDRSNNNNNNNSSSLSSCGDNGAGGCDDGVVVSCEVVLFEHLLWMLESSAETQLGSMDELVEFYTCAC